MSNVLFKANVIVIKPKGSSKEEQYNEFQQPLLLAARNHVQPCICLIDLSEIAYFHNDTVKILLATYRLAKCLGQRLCFCSIPPEGRIIFELLQLDRVFEIYESRADFDAAIAAN